MKKILLSALALVALASCSKNESIETTTDNWDGELRISSGITTRASGTSWDSGDAIGVFMNLTDGGTAVGEGNTKYITTDADNATYSSATFTVDSDSYTDLYYPQSGNVDIVAHYPHFDDEDVLVSSYPIDLKNTPIDFMSAKMVDVAKSKSALNLEFYHLLSQINVTLTPTTDGGLTADNLKTATVTLSGTKLKATAKLSADYDSVNKKYIPTATFEDYDTEADLSQTAADSKTSFIVVPQTATVTFTISVSGYGDFYATASDAIFSSGDEHNYAISVSRTAAKIEGATINPWGTGTGDSLDASDYVQQFEGDYSSIAEVNVLLGTTDDELRLSNCYMVDPAVYGKCIIPVGSRISAYWGDAEYEKGSDDSGVDRTIGEDWTTSDTYTIEPLWNDFSLADYTDKITFSKVAGTDDNYAMQIEFADDFSYAGNMVVAVKKSGTIVWSWHIWVTSYNPYDSDASNGTTYDIDGYGTWMDRNIGALGTAYSTSNNLYYQWGRKDPLPSSATALDANIDRTIADVIKAPEYFYKGSSATDLDWCGNGTNWVQDRDHHWRDAKLASINADSGDKYDTAKSIYDPSPLGFMVPCSVSATEYSSPFNFMGENWSSSDNGIVGTNNIFFPASGYRYSSLGVLYNIGNVGYYFSASPYSDSGSYYMIFNASDDESYVTPSSDNYRSCGYSVRPIQE